MIRLLLVRLLAAFAVAFLGLALLEQFNPHPPRIVISTEHVGMAPTPVDYPRCVTVRPAPLLRSPAHPYDLRLGEPFNDKGIA